MSDQRCSDSDQTKRDIPSFIEPRPPLILNPFMRPRPQKGTNLLELFEEDSESEEPEWLQVYLRLKPCNVRNNLYEVKSDRCLITSVDTAPMGHGRRTQHNVSKMYTFSHIFGAESSQKEIFEHVVKDNLKKLPDGHNFTLLTYGASGSGKTYTLMGTVQAPGLVPRSLEYVFRVVDAAQQPVYKPFDGGAEKLEYYDQELEVQFVRRLRQVSAPLRDKYRRMSAQLRSDLTASTFDLSNRTRYYVWVSFVEIYNEAIYDLLSNCDRSKATSKLRIREDSSGNVYVKGATQAFVRTGEEAYDVMVAGKHNLQVAATGVHANSSRSHCIFTITMLTETEDGGVRSSCVRLCDLAGCERARNTRNTGARMQESRSINSSLHVLERCLHMLRRKQKKIDATLVPYRESKLTRLLGAGLSGARGEAVSMVVTLNPAPQYAHETRHVLQLAAVAKDIQVNQTIAESTLESTATLNSTVDTSAEVMRLRTDNERLHFELIQAQTRNKELLEAMEEKQREVATTMFEIVEEAKDMTRQYYEAQMQSLRAEMEEMQEEYESKLKAAADARQRCSDADTPSRTLQKKITELMTVIAVLEEKLTAEKLARARAEEEVQHLRACIDERDEKAVEAEEQNEEDVMSVTDTDSEEEEDPYNESLEPTFKKEDINRSRMLQQSLINNSKQDNSVSDDVNSDNDVDSVRNDTLRELKDVSQDGIAEDATYSQENSTDTLGAGDSANASELNASTIEVKRQSTNDIPVQGNTTVRGTYFVRDEDQKRISRKSVSEEISEALTSMNRIRQSIEHMEEDFEINLERNLERTISNMTDKITDNIVNRLFGKSTKSRNHESDVSLAQFEQLEIASKKSDPKPNASNESNIKILKEHPKFFDDNGLIPKLNKDKTYFDNIEPNINTNKKLNEIKNLSDDRSPSIVKEDVTNKFEPSTIKKLLGENFTRQAETNTSASAPVALPKKQFSVDIFESPQVITITQEKSREVTTSATETAESYPQPNDKVTAFIKNDISVIKEDVAQNKSTENNISNKLGDNFDIAHKQESHKVNNNKSIFENCVEKASILPGETMEMIEHTRQSVENMILKDKSGKNQTIDIKIKQERVSVEPVTNDSVNNMPENMPESQNNSNNTVEDFEKIYNNITAPRATEFEQLVSSNASHYNLACEQEKATEKPKYNLRHTKANTSVDKKGTVVKKEPTTDKSFENKVNDNQKENTSIDNKDTVDKRDKSTDKKRTKLDKRDESLDKKAETSDEVVLESQARCESKAKPKRNLRLRRRKAEDDQEETQMKTSQGNNYKLKDIVNLQKEFSDVTMGMPAPVKEAKADIESPEKNGEEENLPPLLGIQSCPSKSVTRSRRKLFTPRAEPLEESMAQSGGSNERIRVPRPSYHRTRARRKL